MLPRCTRLVDMWASKYRNTACPVCRERHQKVERTDRNAGELLDQLAVFIVGLLPTV